MNLAPNLELPPPDEDARAASRALFSSISHEIEARGGWIPFSRYMEMALYTPALGYYSGGSQKFGAAGDFTTAPEISPLFGQALARQLAQIMSSSKPQVTEFGAGTGQLAAQILLALADQDAAPEHYAIVEVSGELRERQKAHITRDAPDLVDRVLWLDRLPPNLEGAVIGNEVLDAMPAQIVVSAQNHWYERGVVLDPTGRLAFDDRPADATLLAEILQRVPNAEALSGTYVTEVNLSALAFVASVAERLSLGAAVFIDYGFPASEFYHPQRASGTLMAHYRHRAHFDPFVWPGLQDLTTHVDFSAVVHTAAQAGAQLYGYTSQARFLINCGITDLIRATPQDSMQWLPEVNALQRLLSEAEMGELFKVVSFGRGQNEPLIGFAHGDRCRAL